jgi:Asp/Glu/hydantoin racemase
MRIWHQSFSDLDRAPVYRATLVAHAAKVMDAGDAVTVHGLRPGTYGPDLAPIDAIRFRYIEALNEAQVVEAALAAERTGYDAFALGCFFDPALRQIRSLVEIPVVGLSETCMLTACSLGKSFGMVALNRDQQVRHEELAAEYGLERRFAGATGMDPAIDEYTLEADDAATAPVAEGFVRACRRLLDRGAEVIIPGDGFLNEFVWRRGITAVDGAPVLDSLGTLFRHAAFMAGARARLGLGVSRRGQYAKPPPAMLDQARKRAGVAAIEESDFSGRGAEAGRAG